MADANDRTKRAYRRRGDWKHRFGTEEQRFWEKVDKSGDCWEWIAASLPNGYGYFNSDFERYPHRWSYRKLVGEIPFGLHIDHLCRNRLCVNPEHLEPVTPRVNNLRRRLSRPTHCKRGHAWTDQNTKWGANGTRTCIECRRLGEKRRRAEKRAAKGDIR